MTILIISIGASILLLGVGIVYLRLKNRNKLTKSKVPDDRYPIW